MQRGLHKMRPQAATLLLMGFIGSSKRAAADGTCGMAACTVHTGTRLDIL